MKRNEIFHKKQKNFDLYPKKYVIKFQKFSEPFFLHYLQCGGHKPPEARSLSMNRFGQTSMMMGRTMGLRLVRA